MRTKKGTVVVGGGVGAGRLGVGASVYVPYPPPPPPVLSPRPVSSTSTNQTVNVMHPHVTQHPRIAPEPVMSSSIGHFHPPPPPPVQPPPPPTTTTATTVTAVATGVTPSVINTGKVVLRENTTASMNVPYGTNIKPPVQLRPNTSVMGADTTLRGGYNQTSVLPNTAFGGLQKHSSGTNYNSTSYNSTSYNSTSYNSTSYNNTNYNNTSYNNTSYNNVSTYGGNSTYTDPLNYKNETINGFDRKRKAYRPSQVQVQVQSQLQTQPQAQAKPQLQPHLQSPHVKQHGNHTITTNPNQNMNQNQSPNQHQNANQNIMYNNLKQAVNQHPNQQNSNGDVCIVSANPNYMVNQNYNGSENYTNSHNNFQPNRCFGTNMNYNLVENYNNHNNNNNNNNNTNNNTNIMNNSNNNNNNNMNNLTAKYTITPNVSNSVNGSMNMNEHLSATNFSKVPVLRPVSESENRHFGYLERANNFHSNSTSNLTTNFSYNSNKGYYAPVDYSYNKSVDNVSNINSINSMGAYNMHTGMNPSVAPGTNTTNTITTNNNNDNNVNTNPTTNNACNNNNNSNSVSFSQNIKPYSNQSNLNSGGYSIPGATSHSYPYEAEVNRSSGYYPPSEFSINTRMAENDYGEVDAADNNVFVGHFENRKNYSNGAGTVEQLDRNRYVNYNEDCRLVENQQNLRKAHTVLVTNIPKNLNSQEIYEIFKSNANVLRAKVMTTSNGSSSGCASVIFPDYEAAQRAISKYDGGTLNGKKIRIYMV